MTGTITEQGIADSQRFKIVEAERDAIGIQMDAIRKRADEELEPLRLRMRELNEERENLFCNSNEWPTSDCQ